MRPVSPVIPEWKNAPEVLIAEHQDEYQNLPAIVVDNIVLTRWKLSFWERFTLLFTGSVYLSMWTFGQPLQPVDMTTTNPFIVRGPHEQ